VFRANILKIMIASPGDVKEERAIVTEAVHRWNNANATARQVVLLPVKWETHSTPQLGAPAQTIINTQILDDADIMIGIFGTRIGTPTEDYVSGSVEEIKKHVASGKTAKVYFSDIPISPSKVDTTQYASVQKFREECQRSGLYATYSSLEQFKTDFSHHLDLELNQPRYLWLATLTPEKSDNKSLGEDAFRLLKAAAEADGKLKYGYKSGIIIRNEVFGGIEPRLIARWKAALDELLNSDNVEFVQGSLYQVTHRGYEVIDELSKLSQYESNYFNDAQKDHLSNLLESMTYIQRDLLRYLLLQGGTARGDVISNGKTDKNAPMDWNALTGALKAKGLLEQVDDRMNGHSMYTVNEQLANVIRQLLFPREEGNDTPFFINIPVPIRA